MHWLAGCDGESVSGLNRAAVAGGVGAEQVCWGRVGGRSDLNAAGLTVGGIGCRGADIRSLRSKVPAPFPSFLRPRNRHGPPARPGRTPGPLHPPPGQNGPRRRTGGGLRGAAISTGRKLPGGCDPAARYRLVNEKRRRSGDGFRLPDAVIFSGPSLAASSRASRAHEKTTPRGFEPLFPG
jgi:hypothetical protein